MTADKQRLLAELARPVPGAPALLPLPIRIHPQQLYRTRPAEELEEATWPEQAEGDAAGALVPVTKIRLRSYTSIQGAATVFFRNTTPFTVAIFWLNFQGNEVYYATLAPCGVAASGSPADRYQQPTYRTHPWVAREVSTGARLMLGERMVHVAHGPGTEHVDVCVPPPLQWTAASHCCYAQPFRRSVRALLLTHKRMESIIEIPQAQLDSSGQAAEGGQLQQHVVSGGTGTAGSSYLQQRQQQQQQQQHQEVKGMQGRRLEGHAGLGRKRAAGEAIASTASSSHGTAAVGCGSGMLGMLQRLTGSSHALQRPAASIAAWIVSRPIDWLHQLSAYLLPPAAHHSGHSSTAKRPKVDQLHEQQQQQQQQRQRQRETVAATSTPAVPVRRSQRLAAQCSALLQSVIGVVSTGTGNMEQPWRPQGTHLGHLPLPVVLHIIELLGQEQLALANLHHAAPIGRAPIQPALLVGPPPPEHEIPGGNQGLMQGLADPQDLLMWDVESEDEFDDDGVDDGLDESDDMDLQLEEEEEEEELEEEAVGEEEEEEEEAEESDDDWSDDGEAGAHGVDGAGMSDGSDSESGSD